MVGKGTPQPQSGRSHWTPRGHVKEEPPERQHRRVGTRSERAAHPKRPPHAGPPPSAPREGKKERLVRQPSAGQGEGDERAPGAASPAPPPPRPAPPPQCRLLRKSRACRSNRRRKSHPPHRPLDASAPPGASDWWTAASGAAPGFGRWRRGWP